MKLLCLTDSPFTCPVLSLATITQFSLLELALASVPRVLAHPRVLPGREHVRGLAEIGRCDS